MTRMVEHTREMKVPTKVTAGQVQLARFRKLRDERGGRQTPEPIRRIASAELPTDPAPAR